MMKIDMMMKDTSCWSDRMNEMTAPKTHMITTLYTLIPVHKQNVKLTDALPVRMVNYMANDDKTSSSISTG